MDRLAELLRQGADKLVNFPTEAQRFITNPQAFTQLLTGKNPMPRETGFAAGATGLPAQQGTVLDPNYQSYMQGYEQGEPVGYAGMALPFAAPAAVATAKALAPKAGMMAENYMVKQGMIQPLTAYHGTPHTIQGQFDINKVGTGEGAQAYGHGMYFAESPTVAETYKRAGGGLEIKYGKPLEEIGINPEVTMRSMDFDANPLNQGLGRIVKSLRTTALDYPDVPINQSLVKEHFDEYIRLLDDKYPKDASQKKALQDLVAKEGYPDINFGGNLYKVDIPDADIPKMLDYDKPLKDQPKAVQDALAKYDPDSYSPKGNDYDSNELGQSIYQRIVQDNVQKFGLGGNSKRASEDLNALGIKGIRYYDEGSRSASKGTSNFVVFDPTDVKILEQNSKPVTQSSLQNIVEPIRNRGLTIDAYESKKSPLITLSRIEVPKEMRGTGMGTQALQDLSQYADQTKKTIALSPSKDFGATSVDRLKDFYKRFGFVENKGKNKDFSISESMYRLPAQPTRKEILEQQINKIE